QDQICVKQAMAHVSELRVYPIKGLDPARVESTSIISPGALAFDRRWALVDSQGRFLNGKNRPEIHPIRANYDLVRSEVVLDGRTWSMEREGNEIAGWFSGVLGETVTWRENIQGGFPDDTDSPGPTIVSEASMYEVEGWFGLELEQTRRRFRANIEIAGVEPFWEDRLYGNGLAIGSVKVHAVNPCQRCVVPSRDPFTGAADAGFQKRFSELRKQHLPTWADPAPFSHYYRFTANTRIASSEVGKTIRIGDPVVYGDTLRT
ncbi:MAG: MOSC N-terminal beta barrel domain-containing protein, partial [Acidobacteriota bacterium]